MKVDISQQVLPKRKLYRVLVFTDSIRVEVNSYIYKLDIS